MISISSIHMLAPSFVKVKNLFKRVLQEIGLSDF